MRGSDGVASERGGALAAEPRADGAESGPGELDEQESPGPTASRRGATSLRGAMQAAFSETTFPDYPALVEREFALPAGFVDHDAPISARKWCAPLSRALCRTRDAL